MSQEMGQLREVSSWRLLGLISEIFNDRGDLSPRAIWQDSAAQAQWLYQCAGCLIQRLKLRISLGSERKHKCDDRPQIDRDLSNQALERAGENKAEHSYGAAKHHLATLIQQTSKGTPPASIVCIQDQSFKPYNALCELDLRIKQLKKSISRSITGLTHHRTIVPAHLR